MTTSPEAGGPGPGDPQRTVVHLLRHGEVHNPHRILYGRLAGYHLSGLGRRMADLAAEHLGDHDITHLVSSPLERARETAAPIADSHGLEVHLDERVIEAGNDFEGLPVAGGVRHAAPPAALPEVPQPVPARRGASPTSRSSSGCAWPIVDARAAARGHEAVIVSHQAPIWMIRLATEGRPLWHNPARRECALASLTSFTFLDDELLSLSYSEPAAVAARPGPARGGRMTARPTTRYAGGLAAAVLLLGATACSQDPELRRGAGQGR